MRKRFEVFHDGRWFASVHAETVEEAIERACRVAGRSPAACSARRAEPAGTDRGLRVKPVEAQHDHATRDEQRESGRNCSARGAVSPSATSTRTPTASKR